jgi:imidazoleglycerol-phosphate dehydratase
LGDKKGNRRYGWAYLPMDETIARVVDDFSGRPYLEYRAPSNVASIGNFAFQLVEEILRGFSVHAGCNLHAEILYGRDAHHMAEALFKGLAKAVDQAAQVDPRVEGIPSTKGVL